MGNGQSGQWARQGVTEETEQGCDPSHICPSRPTFAQSTQTLLKTKRKCFKIEKVGPGAAMQFQVISKSNHHNDFEFSFRSAPSSGVRRSSKEDNTLVATEINSNYPIQFNPTHSILKAAHARAQDECSTSSLSSSSSLSASSFLTIVTSLLI